MPRILRDVRILITGATGFVGKFAVRALVEAGHDVRALVRDPRRAAGILGPTVELSAGSALDERAVRTALDGCGGVLHAAAVYSYHRRDTARVSTETPALARSVLGAALAAGVPRVVDVASAIVFTTSGDRVALSTRLMAPGDPTWNEPYARAKFEAEEAARRLRERGLARTAIYPTKILGPEDAGPGTSGESVVALMRGGLTTDVCGGWVDVPDVAAAIVAAFGAPVGTSAIISACSARFREVAALLDELTGRRRRRLFLPAGVIRTMARLNDLAGGRLVPLPHRNALGYSLTSPPIDGSSGEALVGRPYRRFQDTLADAIRWWTANGVIERKLAGQLAT